MLIDGVDVPMSSGEPGFIALLVECMSDGCTVEGVATEHERKLIERDPQAFLQALMPALTAVWSSAHNPQRTFLASYDDETGTLTIEVSAGRLS